MKIKIVVSIVCLISTFAVAINFKGNDDMLRYVRTLIPSNPVILEAGARFGEDSKRMKKLWPGATMHVFEPLSSSFTKLVENTKNLSSFFCYRLALSGYRGSSLFYVNPGNVGASSIGKPLVEVNAREFIETPIEVSCITLDEWAQENGVNHIDFMWLDMEGHEMIALQAGLNVLSTVTAIYTEIDYNKIREGACVYTEIKAFLESVGFKEVWRCQWCSDQGDALFVRK